MYQFVTNGGGGHAGLNLFLSSSGALGCIYRIPLSMRAKKLGGRIKLTGMGNWEGEFHALNSLAKFSRVSGALFRLAQPNLIYRNARYGKATTWAWGVGEFGP